MKKLFTLLFVIAMMASTESKAVFGTTYSIPGPTFTSLRVMIDSLNTYGITGGGTVTLNLNGLFGETTPSGGYVLGSDVLNASLTAARAIVINGNNKTITAPTGSGSMDAIFTIVGADFIKISDLNLEEKATNTTATTMMERGFSIVKTNSSNGCKTISILNCNVTLNNSNTTAASGVAPAGATGFFVGNCTYTSTANLALGTDDSCSHDGIYFAMDTIKNVNNGIYFYGNAVNADGTSYNDKNATLQENDIENFTHLGISLSYFNNDLVQQNYINNTASGGTAPTSNSIFGITYSNPNATLATNTSWTCNKNKITLTTNVSNSYAITGIYTQLNGSGTTDINNDSIKLISSGTSALVYGIHGQNLLGTQNITDNYLYDFTTETTNAQSVFGIMVGGYNTELLGLSTIERYPNTTSTNKNRLENFNVTCGTASGNNRVGLIFDNNISTTISGVTADVNNNVVNNITINATAQRLVGYGCLWGYGLFSPSSVVHTTNFKGNSFSKISAPAGASTNSTPIYLVYPRGTYPYGHTVNCEKNKFTSISSSSGWCVGYFLEYENSVTIDKDTFTDMSSDNWHVYGVFNGNVTHTPKTLSVTNCQFKNFTATGGTNSGAFVAALYTVNATTAQTESISFANNMIQSVSNKDTNGYAFGLFVSGSTTTYNITNNMLSDISASGNRQAYSSSFGFGMQNTGTNNIIFNTIRMNTAATTASGYGATALQYNSGATNTIQNNILHADVQAGSANNVSAIRAANGSAKAAPSVAGFTASSNIYYTPTGSNNYLYVEGTTNTTLVNGYHVSGLTANSTNNIVNDTFFNSECDKSSYHLFMQTGTATREVNTFTENNLSGAAGIYSPSGLSYAEGTATDGAVSTDFTLATRPFGSSDIGALEFAGSVRPQLDITITSSTGFDTACTFNLPRLTGSIPAFFTSVSYQWYRDTSKIVGATTNSITVSPISGNFILKVYDKITGCEYASEPYRMTIVPPPPAIITYYDSLTFCESSAVVLQANKGHNYSYRWLRNGTILAGETNNHLVVDKSGDYALEVNTPLGCPTISTAQRVKVYPLPTPSISFAGPRQLTTQKYYTYQWYKNNVKIDSFSKARTYYCFDDGAYSVEVTDSNGCSAKTDVYLFTLGIGSHPMANAIKLYPNPVQNTLNIESPISLQISLSDLSGRIIAAPYTASSIDMSGLAAGMYLLSLKDQEGNLIRVEKINKVR